VNDPTVSEARAAIDRVDRELLDAFNRRLALVRALHEHKVATGIALHDQGREDAMLARLEEANGGPLSAEGVDELFRYLLDLTRRELHGD
jgi:chorismate mutase / prephenate dehydratase